MTRQSKQSERRLGGQSDLRGDADEVSAICLLSPLMTSPPRYEQHADFNFCPTVSFSRSLTLMTSFGGSALRPRL